MNVHIFLSLAGEGFVADLTSRWNEILIAIDAAIGWSKVWSVWSICEWGRHWMFPAWWQLMHRAAHTCHILLVKSTCLWTLTSNTFMILASALWRIEKRARTNFNQNVRKHTENETSKAYICSACCGRATDYWPLSFCLILKFPTSHKIYFFFKKTYRMY